ncbi:glycosyltransferase family 4 protein [Nitrospira sp. M1]
MNILFLAPHPFYQTRGTPIAVDLMLRVLSERRESVDLLTYHEGSDVQYDQLMVHRIPRVPFVKDIPPGFSLKKLIADGLLAVRAVQQSWKKRYHIVHAVEESVFIALILKLLFGVPYVYDMDSSLAQQMVEKFPVLRPCAFILNYFESVALKHALVVVPVCDSLGKIALSHGHPHVRTLHDVPMLDKSHPVESTSLGINVQQDRLRVMYVGNLESYQGIDLLLDSFSLLSLQVDHVDLVIVGGATADIQKYQQKSYNLGMQERVSFLGPKPIYRLASFLAEADILVSPRIKGNNTPMKLYSYLQSGKPIVATNLPTHTQVLNEEVGVLAEPSPDSFAEGMLSLVHDQDLALKVGSAGKQLVEQKFSYAAFREKVNDLYSLLEKMVREKSGKKHHQGKDI